MAEATFRFHDVSGWIKKHPYATGGAVFVGGAVLIYLYCSSSAPAAAAHSAQGQGGGGNVVLGGSGSYAAGLQAQLASEAQAQASQNTLQALADKLAAQTAGINGAVSVASIHGNTDLHLASLNATTLQDSIAAAESVASAGIASNTTLGLASIGAINYETNAAATASIDKAFYNAGVQISANNNMYQYLDTATLQHAASMNFQTGTSAAVEAALIKKLPAP